MAINLFDKRPGLSASPQGIEGYVSGANSSPLDTYSPRQPGLLTGIGRALSGGTAPFLGDMNWAFKQQQLQLQQDAQDQEFQRYLMSRNSGMRPIDDYYNAMTEAIKKTGKPDPFGSPGSTPQYDDSDYMQTVETRNIRGIPQDVQVRKLKPELDDKQQETLNSATNTLNYLQTVKDLSMAGVKTGFTTPFNETIPLNYKYLKQTGSQKDLSMAQILKQMQSAYITSQTGAQRGFREMKWYEPAMPTGELPPDKLRGMADSSASLMELNIRNMLISADRNSKRLGPNRETLNSLLEKYPLEKYPFGMSQTKAIEVLTPKETERFTVNGKTYDIPKDKVPAFKKAYGL